jgi:hypothetical protein
MFRAKCLVARALFHGGHLQRGGPTLSFPARDVSRGVRSRLSIPAWAWMAVESSACQPKTGASGPIRQVTHHQPGDASGKCAARLIVEGLIIVAVGMVWYLLTTTNNRTRANLMQGRTGGKTSNGPYGVKSSPRPGPGTYQPALSDLRKCPVAPRSCAEGPWQCTTATSAENNCREKTIK